jgi:hypothetical protein
LHSTTDPREERAAKGVFLNTRVDFGEILSTIIIISERGSFFFVKYLNNSARYYLDVDGLSNEEVRQ